MKNINLNKDNLRKLLYKNSCQILKKAYAVKSGHIGGSLSMSQFLLPILYFIENEISLMNQQYEHDM